MHIAAHISEPNLKKSLLLISLRILAAKYPEHRFTFFSETIIKDLEDNCAHVVISPKIKNNLLLFFWYNYRVPRILKLKKKIAFISDAGMLCDAANATQYLFFSNTNFWQNSNTYFKNVFESSLQKATKIFTTEPYFSELLNKENNAAHNKTETVYYGITTERKLLLPLTIELIKNKFTNGCDYYLCPVDNFSKANLTILLKAFSALKKMQKTSMKLVLLLDNVASKSLIENFDNYKYKDEIVFITENDDNRKEIIAAAYTFFSFVEYKPHSLVMLALQNEVPVVLEDTEMNRGIFGEAALYVNIEQKNIADIMQLIYKDETIKIGLRSKAENVLLNYDAEKAAEQLFQAIYIP
jgi:hypothetical protein